ncbi:MAG TPA: ABC transporter [Spirochaetaceae bacterium]|nr:ABC transporter [Spirochaetaceae bacterium]
MIEKAALYLSFPFVRYALIVGVLIALCSALLGTAVVLKRLSFIGDGLSHVAFGSLAVATAAGMTNRMAVVMPVTIISAVLLLRTGSESKVKGDALIAMISAAALAAGYMVMNMFSLSSNVPSDVCSTLFGSASILTLSKFEVWACFLLSLIVVAGFVLYHNRIFAVIFDESFASASGLKTNIYNMLTAVVTAVVIVLAMNLVGSLLISALLVFPALSAMRVCRDFKSVTICASVVSVICALSGMIVSIALGTPIGPTIVLADAIAYICLWAWSRWFG